MATGLAFLEQGLLTEAVDAYQQAVGLDSTGVSANSLNTLCWRGSTAGHAARVMFACEQAVALAPRDGGIRDSRGLARALTGDYPGAIEDFEYYVTWGAKIRPPTRLAQRRTWIEELAAERDPFDAATLEMLKSQ